MRPLATLALVLSAGPAASACGSRTALLVDGTPAQPSASGKSSVPPASSCASPAPVPTPLFSDPNVTISALAVDADAVYFTDAHGDPVVTRVSKCDGTAQALTRPAPGSTGPAGQLAVAAQHVAWIDLIGAGGQVLAASTTPGGDATVLAVTDQPLADSIGLDADHAYFGDGALQSIPVSGGALTALAPGWDGVAAVDDANVYFGESPPTGSALKRVSKSGGSPSVLVASVATLDDFAQDEGSIYWLQWNDSGKGSSVMRVSKSGGAPEVVAGGQDSPHGIAVDDTHVYWTVGNALGAVLALVRAPKGGGAVETWVPGAVGAFVVDATTVYWAADHTLMKLDK